MSLEDLKNKKEQKLTHPCQKVAALLIALGPNTAAEVLKNITDKDLLEQITLNIANLGKLPDDTLGGVLEEFKIVFQAKNYVAQGGVGYAKQLLENIYGADEAGKMLDRVNFYCNKHREDEEYHFYVEKLWELKGILH